MSINYGNGSFNDDQDSVLIYKSFVGAIKFSIKGAIFFAGRKLLAIRCKAIGHDLDHELSISIEEQLCARCGIAGPIAYMQDMGRNVKTRAITPNDFNKVQKSW